MAEKLTWNQLQEWAEAVRSPGKCVCPLAQQHYRHDEGCEFRVSIVAQGALNHHGLTPKSAHVLAGMVKAAEKLWALADSSSYVGDWAEELDALEAALTNLDSLED